MTGGSGAGRITIRQAISVLHHAINGEITDGTGLCATPSGRIITPGMPYFPKGRMCVQDDCCRKFGNGRHNREG